jgi:pyruvate/2-oxoglutarate/acetoin dehydrogenase E1 component
MKYGEAIREALYQELKSEGLYKEFGDRVIDVPLMENTIVGMAIGASLCRLRPIVDLTVANFLYTAMDQIVNMASKLRAMNNYDVPITIMCAEMEGMGAQHTDRPHDMFRLIPGLKIVTPSSPQEAYSTLRASIRDNDPVIYFSDRSLFHQEGDVII